MNWKSPAMKILKKNPHFKKVKKAVLKLYKLLKIMSKKQSVQESQAHVLFKRGVSYYADNLTAAEKPLQKALTIYQRLEKKSKTYTFNVATTLYNLACVFQETNRTKKAESSYTKALKMYRALAQEDSETYTSYVAMTLHSLGLLYWKKRDFQRGEPAFCEAARIYRGLAEKTSDHAADLGDVLNNLGALYYFKGNFKRGEEVYTEALSIYSTLSEKTPDYISDVAMVLNNLGVIFHNMGDFSKAEKVYKDVLHTYSDLAQNAPDRISRVAAALNNLGLFYWKTEDFHKAEEVYTEALSIYRTLSEKTPDYLPDVAMTLGNLGLLNTTVKDFYKAEAAYTEALSIYRTLSEKNDVYTFHAAGILNNLGSLYSTIRKFHKAENACRDVLATYRCLQEKDPAYNPYVAMALKNLGDALSDSGKVCEAKEVYEGALTQYQTLAKTHPAYIPHVAMVRNSQGDLYRDMGKLQKAEEALIEALTQYQALAKTHPAYTSDVATTLGNLGAFYLSTHQFSQAEKAFSEALRITRDLALKNPKAYTPRLASALNMVGVLYSDMGNLNKAETMYTEALQLRQSLAEKDPDVYNPGVAAVLNNLGALYWRNEDFHKAEHAFKNALTIKRALAQRTPAVYEPDVAMISNNLGNVYWKIGNTKKAEEMYYKAFKIREKRELWFEAAESYSGLSLISHDKAEGAVKLLELAILFTGEKKYRYAHKGKREEVYLNVLEYTNDPQKTFGVLEALRDEELLSLQWDLGRYDLGKDQKKVVRTSLKKDIPPLDVPFQIPDDFLVLYIQNREDHILYVVLTRERLATLRGTTDFAAMGSRLLRNLHIQGYAQARRKSVDRLIEDFDTCSAQWGHQLPSEVQKELSQKTYIVFSPDSDCAWFPLEGLHIQGEPLCLSKGVTRITSIHLLQKIALRRISFDSSLIVGNPWPSHEKDPLCYGSPSGEKSELENIGPFTCLKGAESEAETLSRIIRQARVLTRAQATADTVLQELGKCSLLHLAGHGALGRVLFLSGPATRTPPQFDSEEFSRLRRAWRLFQGKSVYMMDEWDLITDRDILHTPLREGAFVFLNACETGRHMYGGGGHFQGLAQAFLKSGASHVISSLIPLFDQSSTDFAVSFYHALRSLPVVTALKETRKSIKNRYKAQVYWLPYIHYGFPLELETDSD